MDSAIFKDLVSAFQIILRKDDYEETLSEMKKSNFIGKLNKISYSDILKFNTPSEI